VVCRMTSHTRLRFKTVVMIFFVVIFAPLGNVFLSWGMKRAGPISFHSVADIPHVFWQIFTSPYIWIGIGFLMLFFLAYTLVLSWADYSFVQPASATAYGVVAILGHFLLHEPISPLRWIGVAVICMGVFVVGNTQPDTTGPRK
jgi:drug/metabolite transporter (DMT)-like permease